MMPQVQVSLWRRRFQGTTLRCHAHEGDTGHRGAWARPPEGAPGPVRARRMVADLWSKILVLARSFAAWGSDSPHILSIADFPLPYSFATC